MPAVDQVNGNSALAENNRRQILLACALERHFLQHGSYPFTLETLADKEVPKTAFDDTPMHYATNADGRFRLWHVGPDGQDDGGMFAGEKSKEKKHANPRNLDYLGDWTWRYEPAK